MEERGELYVLVKTRDLLGYITQVTSKSPKIYRFTYVDRMIHLAMDALTLLFEANEIRITKGNWEKRGGERVDLQRSSISKLRTLAYFAMIAQEGELNVITNKQYLQISHRVDECIKLAQGWLKNDSKRMSEYLHSENKK